MTPRGRLAGALLGLFVAACAGGAPESTPSQRSTIIGGEVSGAEDDAVVRISADQPQPISNQFCNGTLIAPNLLLTALHCVSVFDISGRYACGLDGTLEPPDLGYGRIGETLEPGKIKVSFGTEQALTPDAFGALVLGTGSTHACADDLAFVVLDRDLPSPGFPVRLERPITPGERMTLIGFGLNDSPGAVRLRRRQVPVLSVGRDEASDELPTAPPRSFLVGDGPCGGDGGGPALSDETGAVTGVFTQSFGGQCEPGARHAYTKLAPFASLLERAFASAGRDPRREAASNEPLSVAGGCSVASFAPVDALARRGSAELVLSVGSLPCCLLCVLCVLCRRVRSRRRPSPASARATGGLA